MFHRIAPAGNRIKWQQTPDAPGAPDAADDGYRKLLLNSGTAALAYALILAKQATTVSKPEVIMPGYTCPDVIAAAVYAKVRPVLVDLERDRPYMCPSEINQAINENTVAIVAINFLGIRERFDRIRACIGDKNILLIEDSAQWYPSNNSKTSPNFSGDISLVSFGKGKPVSLLGGGALFVRKFDLFKQLAPLDTAQSRLIDRLKFKLEVFFYNRILSPRFYWLLENAPLIKLGETRYHELTSIQGMDKTRQKLLSANVIQYQNFSNETQEQICAVLKDQDQLWDLPINCDSYSSERLLRYPVLARSAESKREILNRLITSGTGASAFYEKILPDIDGVGELVRCQSNLSRAREFAARLITLPTHQFLLDKHLVAIKTILQSDT